MRIAIVDDDRTFAEAVEGTAKEFFGKRQEAVSIRHFEGTELLEALERGESYELCLLDVEMPGMDGMELAGRIHALDAGVRVVFLTSYDRYALRSYQVGAYHYILKDGYEEELCRILERIRREVEEKKEEYYILCGKDEGYKLSVDEILYLSKEKKYTVFYCIGGESYRERDSIEHVGGRLPQDRFIVINRGIMINMKHIRKFVNLEIVMEDGTLLPVSRRMGKQVKDKIMEYWGKLQ